MWTVQTWSSEWRPHPNLPLLGTGGDENRLWQPMSSVILPEWQPCGLYWLCLVQSPSRKQGTSPYINPMKGNSISFSPSLDKDACQPAGRKPHLYANRGQGSSRMRAIMGFYQRNKSTLPTVFESGLENWRVAGHPCRTLSCSSPPQPIKALGLKQPRQSTHRQLAVGVPLFSLWMR